MEPKCKFYQKISKMDNSVPLHYIKIRARIGGVTGNRRDGQHRKVTIFYDEGAENWFLYVAVAGNFEK